MFVSALAAVECDDSDCEESSALQPTVTCAGPLCDLKICGSAVHNINDTEWLCLTVSSRMQGPHECANWWLVIPAARLQGSVFAMLLGDPGGARVARGRPHNVGSIQAISMSHPNMLDLTAAKIALLEIHPARQMHLAFAWQK